MGLIKYWTNWKGWNANEVKIFTFHWIVWRKTFHPITNQMLTVYWVLVNYNAFIMYSGRECTLVGWFNVKVNLFTSNFFWQFLRENVSTTISTKRFVVLQRLRFYYVSFSWRFQCFLTDLSHLFKLFKETPISENLSDKKPLG